jgi:gamma-glutamyltranspeptidase
LVEGNIHKRKLYAETLRKIADDEETFYAGKLAHTIIKDLKKQGSKMTVEDLKQYK